MSDISFSRLGAFSVLLLSVLYSSANGQSPTVSVFPSLAPNAFGSPSFPTWESNTITALENGLSTFGDPTLPTYYSQIANGALIPPWVATEFPSWHLLANPGTVFGPAFASELGNRLYFNIHIVGNGTQFSISQLSLNLHSSDAGNFLGFSVPAGTFNYNSGYVGLNYGPDHIKGTMDDFFVTGGLNTQLVDELFARGAGNAPAAMIPDPGATDQEKIDNVVNNLPIPFIFTGDYSLMVGENTFTGSAFVRVGVPEPAAIAMMAVGGTGVAISCLTIYRRKSRRKKSKRPLSTAPSVQ